jgi:uncharacterized protein YceK
MLAMKKAVTLGVFSWVLTGCGTVMSVLQSDADVAQDLRRQKTYCQAIPRVYSGLAYDFCMLNGPPQPGGIMAPALLLDLPLSGVFDTISLPYTIYRQFADGHIGIYWRTGGS